MASAIECSSNCPNIGNFPDCLRTCDPANRFGNLPDRFTVPKTLSAEQIDFMIKTNTPSVPSQTQSPRHS